MSHEWHRGVLNTSSWHGLEEVGVMPDADAMIAAGERSGAWPVALRFEELFTKSGLRVAHNRVQRAIVASYQGHPDACVGAVGNEYRETTTAEWRTLVKAACAAGAKPTGAFSLRDGSRVLATFEVGTGNGIRTQLLLVDSFDGSKNLTCGFTSIRVVCANTLASSMRKDGRAMAKLRHTASLEEKVNILAESIGEAIKSGDKLRDTFKRAEKRRLTTAQMEEVFNVLWPDAPADAGKAAQTRAENAQVEALKAMANPVNNCGHTLATLWNAATYLVDRNADGTTRDLRGEAEAIDSLLFGTRAQRVHEVQTIVEVMMRDGTVQHLNQTKALEMGVPAEQVGRAILNDLVDNP